MSFPLYLLTILSLTLFSTSHSHPCFFPKSLPCPPFNSTPPPFPFSYSPGCGHPSFELHCTSPFSLLKINNLSFSLLHYDPLTSSLLLSPLTSNLSLSKNCPSLTHFTSIPPHSITLSGTPLKISEASCSRLSLLKPCPTLTLPNCSLCPWHCSLIKNPTRLLSDCVGSLTRPVSEQGCQSDVLGFLDEFLKLGFQISYDEVEDYGGDEYFSKCIDCRLNKNGICGFNSSDPNKPFLCFFDSFGSTRMSYFSKRKITALSFALILLSLLIFISIFAFFMLKNRNFGDEMNMEDPTTLFLHRHRSPSLLPPVFTYEELEASTNRFDPNRKIGDGGFGSVFLARLFDGRVVAVKYLHRHNHQTFSTKSFCNEILILSSIDHPNLVKLHGYCSDPRGLLLVYDYIPNGTLSDHLHDPTRKGSLTWQIRVDIALQIAIAMEYLHFSVQPAIVHRDITARNIFVDQNMRVRVGDFGLSRLLVYPDPKLSGELLSGSSSGCVWTGPQGTPGYLDPDYHKSLRLTEKSDVYSFGVVLLELITGMKAVDQMRETREVGLVDMVVARIQLGQLDKVVDPVVAAGEGAALADSVAAMAELAFRCVAADKDDRPDAREVVAELRRIWSRTRGVRGSNSNVVVVPAAAES